MLASICVAGLTLTLSGAICADKQAKASQPVGPSSGDSRASPASDPYIALATGKSRFNRVPVKARRPLPSNAQRDSIEGRAHFQAGNYTQARHKLESALRLRPKHAEDLYWLGRTYLAIGSPALAAVRFQDARWNGLDTADLHHYWAVALRQSGQLLGRITQRRPPQEAAEPFGPGTILSEGIVIGPVPGRTDRVIVSPTDSAVYQVAKALALEPNRSDSLLLSAEIWAAIKRHEQAVACFEMAAKHAPQEELARCHQGWAQSLLALGKWDGYVKHAREAMRLAGGNDSAELARCYDRVAEEAAHRGALQKQIRYLTLAVELRPEPDRLIALSEALTQAHRFQEAVRSLEQALEQNPSAKQRLRIQRRLKQVTATALP